MHGFLTAIEEAYNYHYPLCFGPDHIWILIAQGVSKHVENNAEKLRSKFVEFEGKKELLVRDDSFKLGNPNNPW